MATQLDAEQVKSVLESTHGDRIVLATLVGVPGENYFIELHMDSRSSEIPPEMNGVSIVQKLP